MKNIIHKTSPKSTTKTKRCKKLSKLHQEKMSRNKKVGEKIFEFSLQNPNSDLATNYLLITYITSCLH
jgi:hypothetical protein